jgi:Family of unknown function (DUF5947)
MCSEPISDEHRHVVDLEARGLLCTCTGCYLLFTSAGAGGGHYRAVPGRYAAFPKFTLSPSQWDALQIPVGLAFFFLNSVLDQVVAFYPGPAGATESELPLDTWSQLVDANPALETLEPDVEAFLVRAGHGEGVTECYIVPIDLCYELVGHLRRVWRGFDGGRESHDAIDQFFGRIRARAQ